MLHLSVFHHYDKGSYYLTKKYERFPMLECCRRGGGREREREMVRIFLDVDVP